MGFDTEKAIETTENALNMVQGIFNIVKQVEKPETTGVEKFAIASGLAKSAFPQLEENKIFKGINLAVEMMNLLGVFKKSKK